MKFDTPMLDVRRKEMRAGGYWRDELCIDHLDHCVAQVPDKTAIAGFNSMEGEGRRLSYREFGMLVDRMAVGLAELGIEKNDIVSCQLPNWWQFAALAFACWRIGAVVNPMMPIFREREVKFMLGFAESKLFVVPREYREFDYPGMVRGIRSELPHLQRMLVIGGSGAESFEQILLETPWETKRDAKRLFAERRQTPDDVIQLLYTSGTTGEPKGVMHTSNTLLSHLYPFCERLDLKREDIVLMSSPLAHQTGFLYGVLTPILLRTTVVL
jgi:cyclohexanecarboxylate-CoA ligase